MYHNNKSIYTVLASKFWSIPANNKKNSRTHIIHRIPSGFLLHVQKKGARPLNRTKNDPLYYLVYYLLCAINSIRYHSEMTIVVYIWSTSNQLVHFSKIDSKRAWKKIPFGAPTFLPTILHVLHDICQKGSLIVDVFLCIIAFIMVFNYYNLFLTRSHFEVTDCNLPQIVLIGVTIHLNSSK